MHYPLPNGPYHGLRTGLRFQYFRGNFASSCDLVLFRQVCKCRKGACEDISLLRVTQAGGPVMVFKAESAACMAQDPSSCSTAPHRPAPAHCSAFPLGRPTSSSSHFSPKSAEEPKSEGVPQLGDQITASRAKGQGLSGKRRAAEPASTRWAGFWGCLRRGPGRRGRGRISGTSGWLQDIASDCPPWIPNPWPSSSASWGLSVPEVSRGPEQCGPPW